MRLGEDCPPPVVDSLAQEQQMSTDLQGGGFQPQSQQPAQQPIQQTQQPVQPQGNPQINYVPVNPQTGMPQPPAQPAAQPQPQVNPFDSFRQAVAQEAGMQLNEVPTDPTFWSRAVANGMKAMQQLKAYQQQQSQQQPQQQQVQQTPQQQAQQQLTEKNLPPSWETMITRDQNGAWVPTVDHPFFRQVAQDKNWNDQVRSVRQSVVTQGQFLPEHQQLIAEEVNKRISAERENWESKQFMESHRNDLFEMGPDGQPVKEIGMNGESLDKLSPLGVEFNIAAQELEQAGQFASKATLAKMAHRVAKDRLAAKQAQQQQTQAVSNGPPAQAKNDLDRLFLAHRNSGAAAVANTNGHQSHTLDIRSALQRDLAHLPNDLNSVDYLRELRRR